MDELPALIGRAELTERRLVTRVRRRPINPQWGDGPWRDEPDRLEWRDQVTGLPCLIRRIALGSLAGYVAVPPGHPLHSRDAIPEGVDRAVHGGVTFVGESFRRADGDGVFCMACRDDAELWWNVTRLAEALAAVGEAVSLRKADDS